MKSKRSLKEIRYILWEYYRWHILVVALVTIFVISFSYIQFTKPADGFCAFVVNGTPHSETSDIALQFSEFAQIDPAEQQTTVEYLTITEDLNDEGYAAMQKIITYASSQRLDAVVMDKALFSAYAYEGLFADLRTVLNCDQLAGLNGKLYYADGAALESALQGASLSSSISKDASAFETPIPIGIDLSCFPQFAERIIYPGNDPCIAIANSSQRKDLAALFIEFLISE